MPTDWLTGVEPLTEEEQDAVLAIEKPRIEDPRRLLATIYYQRERVGAMHGEHVCPGPEECAVCDGTAANSYAAQEPRAGEAERMRFESLRYDYVLALDTLRHVAEMDAPLELIRGYAAGAANSLAAPPPGGDPQLYEHCLRPRALAARLEKSHE